MWRLSAIVSIFLVHYVAISLASHIGFQASNTHDHKNPIETKKNPSVPPPSPWRLQKEITQLKNRLDTLERLFYDDDDASFHPLRPLRPLHKEALEAQEAGGKKR